MNTATLSYPMARKHKIIDAVIVNQDERTPIQKKVEAAKLLMGEKLTCHWGYQQTPRHSLLPNIYTPARQTYLDEISARAKADRESNPAYHIAQAYFAIVEQMKGN